MEVATGELPQSHTATKYDKAINNIMSINALMCTDSSEHTWAGLYSDNSGGGGGGERIKDTTDSDTEQEDSLTQDQEPHQYVHEPFIDTKPNPPVPAPRQDEDLASKKAARKQSSCLAKKPKLPKRIESPKQVLDLTSLGTLGTYNSQLLLHTSTSDICRNDLAILHHVFRHSRRLVVITGAGISVAAGIPDFRSSTGLFKLLKNDLKLKASGKQLFDASVVYNDLDSTNHFHGIMCDLYNLCFSSPPTPFHSFINKISQESRLLRLYTQNIDCIDTSLSHLATKTPLEAPWPQTVQLHGTIKYMNCAKCNWTSEFDPKLFEASVSASASASDGEDSEASSIPECPECLKVNSDRSIAGKRQQGVGRLRPKIVLYNEFNPDAEAIGKVTEGDLACRPDGLIVVGTSLKIPGVRRMVREMAQAVHAANGATVWMNIDDPPPQITKREFEGCFDLVVKGDCQIMPELMRDYEQERDEIEEGKAQERKAKMEAREAAKALRQKQIQEREERRKKQGASAGGKDGKVAKKKSVKAAVAAGRSASEVKQSKPAAAKQQAAKARKLKTTGATVDLVMPDTPEPPLNISSSSSSVSCCCSSSEEGPTDASSRDTSPPIPGPYAQKSHSHYEYGTGTSFLASPLPFLATMPSSSSCSLDIFKLNSLSASTEALTMPKHRTLGVGKKRSVSGTIPPSTGVNSISKVSK